jgi:hypothetical protein
VVDLVAFSAQQRVKTPIAEATALTSKRGHALPKIPVIGSSGLVSHRHATTAYGFTRPPFAHPVMLHQVSDSLPLRAGRYH